MAALNKLKRIYHAIIGDNVKKDTISYADEHREYSESMRNCIISGGDMLEKMLISMTA